VEHGSPYTTWEGIGTGWFHSVLGGGGALGLRPVGLHTPRTDVSQDNPSLGNPLLPNPVTDRMRGDFAVPTLFNGNFDAVAFNAGRAQTIPGWSLYNDSVDALQNQLVDINTIPSLNGHLTKLGSNRVIPNYAVELASGESITHNPFVVPDWGVLRFDLHAPSLSGGDLKVSIRGDGPIQI
jgi:hypothetical protein